MTTLRLRRPALAALLAAGALAALLPAGAAAVPAGRGVAATGKASAAWRARSAQRLRRDWGVDLVGVRPVSSGLMLRLDFRVVEPGRAAAFLDKKVHPFLVDEATRTALAVPAMENVGELRQVAAPERDRTYYMIFGNPGRLVKAGSRVTLVVGDFRAEGVVVNP